MTWVRRTVGLAALLGWTLPSLAGIADSPLPVLVSGQATLYLYSVSGVVSAGNLATFFVCTSTDSAPQQVGVETFYSAGGPPCNDGAATSVNVGPGVTVKFGTRAAANDILGGQAGDSLVGGCPPGTGAARILSTSKKLVCTAFVGDYVNVPPSTSWQLPIIAKLKQKAAN